MRVASILATAASLLSPTLAGLSCMRVPSVIGYNSTIRLSLEWVLDQTSGNELAMAFGASTPEFYLPDNLGVPINYTSLYNFDYQSISSYNAFNYSLAVPAYIEKGPITFTMMKNGLVYRNHAQYQQAYGYSRYYQANVTVGDETSSDYVITCGGSYVGN